MLLSKKPVAELVGYSGEHIRRLSVAGRFPRPIAMSGDLDAGWSRKGWLKSEVDDWLAARVAERDAGLVVKRESEISRRAAAASPHVVAPRAGAQTRT